MFCTKCGAPLEDGSSFCTMCGTPLEGSSEADSHAESVVVSSQAPGSAPSSVAASAPVSASPSIPAPAPVPAPAPAPAPVPASKRTPIIIAVVAVIVVAVIGCAWFAISSNAANEEGAQGRVQSQPADVPGKGASSDEGSEASPSEGSVSIVDSQKKGFEGGHLGHSELVPAGRCDQQQGLHCRQCHRRQRSASVGRGRIWVGHRGMDRLQRRWRAGL